MIYIYLLLLVAILILGCMFGVTLTPKKKYPYVTAALIMAAVDNPRIMERVLHGDKDGPHA